MGGRSSSTSIQRETDHGAFGPGAVTAWPRGDDCFGAAYAALLELEHFSQKDYADDVKASQEFYESQIGKEEQHVR